MGGDTCPFISHPFPRSTPLLIPVRDPPKANYDDRKAKKPHFQDALNNNQHREYKFIREWREITKSSLDSPLANRQDAQGVIGPLFGNLMVNRHIFNTDINCRKLICTNMQNWVMI